MISALCFLPRGAAKETPDQQELSAEEMDALVQKQAGLSLAQIDSLAPDAPTENADGAAESDSDADENGDAAMEDDDEKKADNNGADSGMTDKEAQLLKELGMDGYDEEPEGAELMLGGQKLLVHENNADDPYVTVPDHEDYDAEDDEDLVVKNTDVVICVGKTEEEASSVEVYLYEEEGGNLYVHHDFNLPSFPLAMCWMDVDPRSGAAASATSASASAASPAAASSTGFTDATSLPHTSFLAVGTFQTGIELWNLDVLDVLEPTAILGGREEPDAETMAKLAQEQQRLAKMKGKKSQRAALEVALAAKMAGELKEGSHQDAIMCLAWHPSVRTRLASGSADASIKLWDIATQRCVSTFSRLHSNKVQSLAWNAVEPNILLSAGYDQTAVVTDVRADPSAGPQASFALGADPEQVRWSPHQPFLFAAALENGQVKFFDARAQQRTPMFTLAAHAQACTNFTWNNVLPGCFATASLDKTVKIWDLSSGTPSLITTKEVKACGSIFSCAFDSNYPHLLAFGGDKGKLGIWDLREDGKCRAKWGDEVDGKMRGASQQQNPFAMQPGMLNTAAAAATPAPASSSSSAPATGSSAGKKKKKMKTSERRVRDDSD